MARSMEYIYSVESGKGSVNEVNMIRCIEDAGLSILDRHDWDREVLKQVNKHNTEVIERNVKRLVAQYPEKSIILNGYLKNQKDECKELEQNCTCTTLILENKKYSA